MCILWSFLFHYRLSPLFQDPSKLEKFNIANFYHIKNNIRVIDEGMHFFQFLIHIVVVILFFFMQRQLFKDFLNSCMTEVPIIYKPIHWFALQSVSSIQFYYFQKFKANKVTKN